MSRATPGTTDAVFTVTLSPVSTNPVTVIFQTADDTALAGSDDTAASGMLTFAPGTTTQTATVSVTGDAASEDNEAFFVRLSSPTNGIIADGEALGTILDDDAADFFAILPCRVVDTRLPPGSRRGPALPANTTRVFPVTGGACAIPADARAVALNVTTVNEGDFGDLRLIRRCRQSPLASTINFSAGKARANNAIVVLGTAGRIAVRQRHAFRLHGHDQRGDRRLRLFQARPPTSRPGLARIARAGLKGWARNAAASRPASPSKRTLRSP